MADTNGEPDRNAKFDEIENLTSENISNLTRRQILSELKCCIRLELQHLRSEGNGENQARNRTGNEANQAADTGPDDKTEEALEDEEDGGDLNDLANVVQPFASLLDNQDGAQMQGNVANEEGLVSAFMSKLRHHICKRVHPISIVLELFHNKDNFPESFRMAVHMEMTYHSNDLEAVKGCCVKNASENWRTVFEAVESEAVEELDMAYYLKKLLRSSCLYNVLSSIVSFALVTLTIAEYHRGLDHMVKGYPTHDECNSTYYLACDLTTIDSTTPFWGSLVTVLLFSYIVTASFTWGSKSAETFVSLFLTGTCCNSSCRWIMALATPFNGEALMHFYITTYANFWMNSPKAREVKRCPSCNQNVRDPKWLQKLKEDADFMLQRRNVLTAFLRGTYVPLLAMPLLFPKFLYLFHVDKSVNESSLLEDDPSTTEFPMYDSISEPLLAREKRSVSISASKVFVEKILKNSAIDVQLITVILVATTSILNVVKIFTDVYFSMPDHQPFKTKIRYIVMFLANGLGVVNRFLCLMAYAFGYVATITGAQWIPLCLIAFTFAHIIFVWFVNSVALTDLDKSETQRQAVFCKNCKDSLSLGFGTIHARIVVCLADRGQYRQRDIEDNEGDQEEFTRIRPTAFIMLEVLYVLESIFLACGAALIQDEHFDGLTFGLVVTGMLGAELMMKYGFVLFLAPWLKETRFHRRLRIGRNVYGVVASMLFLTTVIILIYFRLNEASFIGASVALAVFLLAVSPSEAKRVFFREFGIRNHFECKNVAKL